MIKAESQKHKDLVAELLNWLKNNKSYRITGADLKGYNEPKVVKNSDGIGDGENKKPDIDAKDDAKDVYVRGVHASEHSATTSLCPPRF